jgi:hypothetical protein
MRKAAIIMAVAVLAGGINLNLDGSRRAGNMAVGQAFGDEEVIPNDNFVPDEAEGFRGTLSAKVVQTRNDNWFVIKVVKVIRLSAKNHTKLNAKALTAVWKDKYTNILGVKGMPKLKAGDMVTVVAYQHEKHLRSTKVSKVKPSDDR